VSALSLFGRIAFGVLFLAGGVFNLTYGRRHPDEFYGSFADSAWVAPCGSLIRRWILPHGALFAVVLGAFELAVAALILSGGTAMVVGLAAGIAFALAVAPASNAAGALANLALASGQAALLWSLL
jgi:uncharacterized membrane protein YphA (DoxX/SURF4 family)